MITGKGIPFVDLVTPYVELQEELLAAVKGVLTSAMFIGGPVLEKFERDFAQFTDSKYCVGVSSGTDALRFALMASDVGRGDIVLTVANTFVATIEAIVQAGATPHFVDIDPLTFNMSVDSVREFLQSQCRRDSKSGLPVHSKSGQPVKAIMPVHLYGQMCDMDSIMTLAEEYGLSVFEDACQAHGSEYFSVKKNAWQKAGSIGKAGSFSFYPGKNLGACGEAGAVTTNDESLVQRIRMIRDHGQNKKYHHLVEGYNGRLDAMQAAMLSVKLPFLSDWNAKRRDAAQIYNELLGSSENVRTPYEPSWSRANYHLYVILCGPEREELQKHLTERNIGTGLHYPIPLHLQKGYTSLGYRTGDLPVTEELAGEILSLPMYPQLRRYQQEQVVESLLQFYSTKSVETPVEPR
jgi:dTDP-4-amino-4,6-dideoxygalactose transaminase